MWIPFSTVGGGERKWDRLFFCFVHQLLCWKTVFTHIFAEWNLSFCCLLGQFFFLFVRDCYIVLRPLVCCFEMSFPDDFVIGCRWLFSFFFGCWVSLPVIEFLAPFLRIQSLCLTDIHTPRSCTYSLSLPPPFLRSHFFSWGLWEKRSEKKCNSWNSSSPRVPKRV